MVTALVSALLGDGNLRVFCTFHIFLFSFIISGCDVFIPDDVKTDSTPSDGNSDSDSDSDSDTDSDTDSDSDSDTDNDTDSDSDSDSDGDTDSDTDADIERETTIDGLIWEIYPDGTAMSLSDAVTHCENLNLNGHYDWRVPTISELRTLVDGCPATETSGSCTTTDDCLSCLDDTCSSCFEDGGNGPDAGCFRKAVLNGTCGVYWSSSTDEIFSSEDRVWCIHFGYGMMSSCIVDSVNNGPYVRCVRPR